MSNDAFNFSADLDENYQEIVSIFEVPIRGNYDWSYSMQDERIARLHDLGKKQNWNADIDINWHIPTPPKTVKLPDNYKCEWTGFTPFDEISSDKKLDFLRDYHAWGLSQTLHGEQAALLISSQLVSYAPTMIAKLYAASQVYDEARHVEVFERYIREREKIKFPIGRAFKGLIDQLLIDQRWDVKFIGMQLIIENLALANFNRMKKTVFDPVLQYLFTMVARDEARHVAFGLDYLENYYKSLSNDEIRDRFEFSYKTCELVGETIKPYDVWAKFGWDLPASSSYQEGLSSYQTFLTQLAERIIPHMRRIGLLGRDIDYKEVARAISTNEKVFGAFFG